jgi:PKD repeat protein
MKKRILLLSCLATLCYSTAWAQINITLNHMPASGDTIRYSSALSYSGFNRFATGTDTTWNFLDLEPASQDRYDYKISSQTPYLFNFGFTALGLKIADTIGTNEFALTDVYNFYDRNSSKFANRGLGFKVSLLPIPLAGTYSSEDIIYNLPLRYNDSATKSFALNIPLGMAPFSLGTFFRTGTRTTVVDGWGKISTPYKKDVPCLRVRSIINSKDSIVLSGSNTPIVFNSITMEYKWLSQSEKIPMLEISGNMIGNNFIPTTIRYRDSFRDLSSNDPVEIDFTVDKNTGIAGFDTFTFTSQLNVNAIGYQWSFSPSSGIEYLNGTSSSSANPKVKFNNTGSYNVSLNAATSFGQRNKTELDYINIQTNSIHNFNKNIHSEIVPNPASDNIFINSSEYPCRIEIRDINGKLLLDTSIEFSNSKISVSHLPNGTYFIKTSHKQGSVVEKLIKY